MDLGYRSVEVGIRNDLPVALTIESATGNTWVPGEAPAQGALLEPYFDVVWGVKTDAFNGTASGVVTLTGAGSQPLTITFSNTFSENAPSVSACPTVHNDKCKTVVTKVATGDANHSVFTVQIVPDHS